MTTNQTDHVPPLQLHKGTQQGYVRLDGRRVYLGRFDDPATRQKYDRTIGEWLAGGRQPLDRPADLTVTEVIDRFMRHADATYAGRGAAGRRTVLTFERVMRTVRALYGSIPASTFSPRMLKAVREAFIADPQTTWVKALQDTRRQARQLTRDVVNRYTRLVVRMFRFAVSEELVPSNVLHALQAVDGLRRGYSDLPDGKVVGPVSDADIDAIKPFVNRHVWAIVQLLRCTGARAGEILVMRPVDLRMEGDVWEYRPEGHKTKWHGHTRCVYLGPKAIAVVREFLSGRAIDAYLFDPREAVAEFMQAMYANGAKPSMEPERHPKRPPLDRYTTASVRRAVERACRRAGIQPWGLHRIRHAVATALDRQFGRATAAIVLGHATLKMTDRYVDPNRAAAVEAARRIG